MMSFLYPAYDLPQQPCMGSIQKPGLLPAIAFWQKGSEKEMGNLKAEVSQHRSRAVGGGERFLEEEFSLQ